MQGVARNHLYTLAALLKCHTTQMHAVLQLLDAPILRNDSTDHSEGIHCHYKTSYEALHAQGNPEKQ